MMVVPKANIKAIYSYLLAEGVIVVKKDPRQEKHEEVPVSNLEAMNVLKSLKSRGYVTEAFSWQHYYYYLTDDGIVFLRNYLHLPETTIPSTVAKAQRAAGARGSREPTDVREDGRRGDARRSAPWRGKEQTA